MYDSLNIIGQQIERAYWRYKQSLLRNDKLATKIKSWENIKKQQRYQSYQSLTQLFSQCFSQRKVW